jgi:hypothetical protein
MGVKLLALAAAALVLGGVATPTPGVAYLESRQDQSGGFAESGGNPDLTATAWAGLALAAGGGSAEARGRALAYLRANEGTAQSDLDVALQVLARAALGDHPDALLSRLRAYRPARFVNATIWTMLALRQAREPIPPALVAELRARQQRSGGWSWTRGGAPDSNDTAAAVEALRASGVTGPPIARAFRYLERCRNVDGGYGLLAGRASDAQSTAWAIQAFIAGRREPSTSAFRFLTRMRRRDGSYRYSKLYATTPVWVTSQVVPALARKPFPLAVT